MLSMDLVQEQEQESSCYFDNIPDDVLLLVFNKLLDAKSLIRCLTVSKRFAFLILQTDTVSLPLLPHSHARKPNRSGFPVNLFKLLVHKLISKPLQFLHLNTKSHTNYCPHQVLKIFNQLKSVHLELPSYGGGVAVKPGDGADSLLKWKADFGSDLKRCTVLYATSFQRRTSISKRIDEDQPLLRNEEMKSRIAWTISCLIAASARHYLLKHMVTDFPKLQRIVITDSNKQGRISMEEEELVELRDFVKETSTTSLIERGVIPDLRIKLWYVAELELPSSGYEMKGATLVEITPVGKGSSEKMDGGDFDGDETEKVIFDEAVKEMLKTKKKYVMEMSSF